jgi:hypothetical protein
MWKMPCGARGDESDFGKWSSVEEEVGGKCEAEGGEGPSLSDATFISSPHSYLSLPSTRHVTKCV